MTTESYEEHQKKVCAYIEEKYPEYFTSVNRLNFFSTFLHMPKGHGEIYNTKNKKWFVQGG